MSPSAGPGGGPLDLNQLTSPYTGSTTNAPNNIALTCGGYGNEQGFYTVLQPGETISIGQTYNDYDSRHELSYGGSYPGDVSLACRDDPDTNTETYTNTGTLPVNVYFIIDAYSSGFGTFTLEWTITPSSGYIVLMCVFEEMSRPRRNTMT